MSPELKKSTFVVCSSPQASYPFPPFHYLPASVSSCSLPPLQPFTPYHHDDIVAITRGLIYMAGVRRVTSIKILPIPKKHRSLCCETDLHYLILKAQSLLTFSHPVFAAAATALLEAIGPSNYLVTPKLQPEVDITPAGARPNSSPSCIRPVSPGANVAAAWSPPYTKPHRMNLMFDDLTAQLPYPHTNHKPPASHCPHHQRSNTPSISELSHPTPIARAMLLPSFILILIRATA